MDAYCQGQQEGKRTFWNVEKSTIGEQPVFFQFQFFECEIVIATSALPMQDSVLQKAL
jgi:hypothetical protein